MHAALVLGAGTNAKGHDAGAQQAVDVLDVFDFFIKIDRFCRVFLCNFVMVPFVPTQAATVKRLAKLHPPGARTVAIAPEPGQQVVDSGQVTKRSEAREHVVVLGDKRVLGRQQQVLVVGAEVDGKGHVTLVDRVRHGELRLARLAVALRQVEGRDDLLDAVRDLLVVAVRAHARGLAVGVRRDAGQQLGVEVVAPVRRAVGPRRPARSVRQRALVHLHVGHAEAAAQVGKETRHVACGGGGFYSAVCI